MYVDPSNLVSSTAGAAAASVSQTDDARKRPRRVAESRLGQEYARVLHRALQMEGREPEAMKQLQEALESGQFDTVEAAIQAARTLIKYGI